MNGIKTLWHRLGSPRWFYQMMKPWQTGLGWVAMVALLVGTIWGLAFAPEDYQQGNSFRIIYVHVPMVVLAQSAYMMLGAAGFVLLVWRMKMADVAMVAIVPVGMTVTAIGLFSGAVWGRPTWGTWWEWTDARLVSTLVLLFLYVGLYALREAIPRAESAGRACAVLAVVGLVNIPIIKYSVEWWTTLHQGATFTATRMSMPMEMAAPLMVNVIGAYSLFGYLVLMNMRTELLRRERDTSWVGALRAEAVDGV